MNEVRSNAVDHDLKTLVTDAQALFQSAAALTGEKAEEARTRGMRLLDSALTKAQEVQAGGKKIIASTDHYVKENPWRAIGMAAGAGLLVGVFLGRR
ncbi:DUF883 family protein [Chitinimonas viridis]|uniref:DUF883 family protein n=1 Tax=Chitinimonas viridis TaxID=664880 RepID=A0ABT8B056_9NEIS|nr:DUF883 family protein [Chitinimonas viridis]MDN3575478.1 DUF883 family protein [Chitinimonas viridis]